MRRGLVFNLVSNVTFLLSAYVIHYFLGHIMSPAEYGIVGTIMTVLDIEYLFLSNGARQSLAKEMSLDRFAIPDVIVKTALFQFILITVFFLLTSSGHRYSVRFSMIPRLTFTFA